MTADVRSAWSLYVYGALGTFLLAVPWTGIWDHATLVVATSEGAAWVRSGWIRGLVSGIGTLDLLVASREAGVLWRSLRPGAVPQHPR